MLKAILAMNRNGISLKSYEFKLLSRLFRDDRWEHSIHIGFHGFHHTEK